MLRRRSSVNDPETNFFFLLLITYRKWNKGTLAHFLDDPSGTPWILKSQNSKYGNESDLTTLDKKLKLPQGWKFRVVTVKEDLIEVPVNGTAWLVIDEKQGVWDKAQAGTGMNYTP